MIAVAWSRERWVALVACVVVGVEIQDRAGAPFLVMAVMAVAAGIGLAVYDVRGRL